MNSNRTPSVATIICLVMITAASQEAYACHSEAPPKHSSVFGNKKLNRVDYSNTCCKKFIDEVKENDMDGCDAVCTECIGSETNGTLNLDICLGIGCSSSRWCGLHAKYKRFNCSKCRSTLRRICNIDNIPPCKERTKRDSDRYNEDHEGHPSSSSQRSHRTKITDEKQLIDARNTLESAFFSLSSAIRTGKSKTLKEETSDLDIDSEMVIEIVQSRSGVVFVIGLIVLLYRTRNRFNRIIHRKIPKSILNKEELNRFWNSTPIFFIWQNLQSSQTWITMYPAKINLLRD